MKIGFMLPVFGEMASSANVLAMAQLAEVKGFESIWVPDHVIMPVEVSSPYPYTKSAEYIADPKGAHLEPFTVLSFVAACTTRVKLGFTVIVAPYRNPIVTGKMMASMDVLSNGRLIAGVGAGWLEEEFDALEVPFEKRWLRTEEHIRIWKELWTAEEPRFEGQFHRFSNVQCRPQPLQKPHPPITIGGNGKACFRRVVALADGWQVVSEGPEDVYSGDGSLRNSLRTLREMADEAGRDFESIEITAVVIAGTPEGVLADIPSYEALGVSRLILDFPSFVSDPNEMAATLEKIASEAPMEAP
jgi:probable F420-dependent oxidoreductase